MFRGFVYMFRALTVNYRGLFKPKLNYCSFGMLGLPKLVSGTLASGFGVIGPKGMGCLRINGLWWDFLLVGFRW